MASDIQGKGDTRALYADLRQAAPKIAKMLAQYVGDNLVTREAHTKLTGLYRQCMEQIIAMRLHEVEPHEPRIQHPYKVQSLKWLRAIITSMQSIVNTIPEEEERFHSDYEEWFEKVEQAVFRPADGAENNNVPEGEELDDGGSAPLHTTIGRDPGIFPLIPVEIDGSIRHFLSAAELARAARVNVAFYRGLHGHVHSMYQGCLQEALELYCHFIPIFGPDGLWDDQELLLNTDPTLRMHGNTLRDIYLNYEKIAIQCTWYFRYLLSVSRALKPALEHVVEGLCRLQVSSQFKAILINSLENVSQIRDSQRLHPDNTVRYRAMTQDLVVQGRYSEALACVFAGSMGDERIWEVITATASANEALADYLVEYALESHNNSISISIARNSIRAWPDSEFKNRALLKLEEHRRARERRFLQLGNEEKGDG